MADGKFQKFLQIFSKFWEISRVSKQEILSEHVDWESHFLFRSQMASRRDAATSSPLLWDFAALPTPLLVLENALCPPPRPAANSEEGTTTSGFQAGFRPQSFHLASRRCENIGGAATNEFHDEGGRCVAPGSAQCPSVGCAAWQAAGRMERHHRQAFQALQSPACRKGLRKAVREALHVVPKTRNGILTGLRSELSVA